MALYETGTITGAANAVSVIGTGTKWSDAKFGINRHSLLIVLSESAFNIYQIQKIVSDTEITLTREIAKPFSNSIYGIMTAETASTASFANQVNAMLAYYQSQLNAWQSILTGKEEVTVLAPDGTEVIICLDDMVASSASKIAIKAAGEAKESATQAKSAKDSASASEKTASKSATDAKTSATAATKSSETATREAGRAKIEANRAKSEADRAEGAANEVDKGPIEIPDARNLNDYIVPGQYYQPRNINAVAGENYPVKLAGALLVYRSAPTNTAPGVEQIYITYNNNGIFQRALYNNLWKPWERIYTTAYKPTAADVGAYPVTGGLINGWVDMQGNLTALNDRISLKGDERKRFSIIDADGQTRMYIYKDKGGDGVHLNNGYDGGGDWILHKNGQLYCPGNVRAGNAVLDVRGNLYGDAWGNSGLWHYLLDVAMPVGIPQPWPGATPPHGWLKCNGSAFNKTLYPKLATAYPTGKLPDLRGEFIRGWDDGRGVDAERGLLSEQLDELRRHAHEAFSNTQDPGLSKTAGGDGSHWYLDVKFNTYDLYGKVTTRGFGGAETRPRNIAFNYIVRAA